MPPPTCERAVSHTLISKSEKSTTDCRARKNSVPTDRFVSLSTSLLNYTDCRKMNQNIQCKEGLDILKLWELFNLIFLLWLPMQPLLLCNTNPFARGNTAVFSICTSNPAELCLLLLFQFPYIFLQGKCEWMTAYSRKCIR